MASVPVPKSEQAWQAESDARTIADAAAVKADKVRLNRAKKAAVGMAKEASAKATALRSLTRGKRSTGRRKKR